jgi:hypothetical protein
MNTDALQMSEGDDMPNEVGTSCSLKAELQRMLLLSGIGVLIRLSGSPFGLLVAVFLTPLESLGLSFSLSEVAGLLRVRPMASLPVGSGFCHFLNICVAATVGRG